MTDETYMEQALHLAHQAQIVGEVPVGAIIVYNGEIIAQAHNQPIRTQDPTAHAEILALRQAGQFLGNYRLLNTTLYTTLEPCTMCVGAMVHARIARLVYAASDPKAGAVCSALALLNTPHFNHSIAVTASVSRDASETLLKSFFKQRR